MATSAYTPFEVGAKDRIVGFFVIGSVLLLLLGFILPQIQKLNEEEGIPFYTVLDQTYGIAKDATVSLSGVIIGKVAGVTLTTDGMVKVDIALSSDYADFYTNNSRLTVDSNIGVSTILTGSGLILMPGAQSNGLLEQGSMIVTDIPQGFGSILEQVDLAALADQVTGIVDNVDNITTGIAQNQGKIYASLDNLEEVTKNVADVSAQLPGMVNSVDQSLQSLQGTMSNVDKMVLNAEKDMQQILANTAALTEQATATLAETEIFLRATTPVMNQLPTFLITTNVMLQSVTRLTDQLSRSWLLGGGGTEEVPVTIGPAAHPHDDELYESPKPGI